MAKQVDTVAIRLFHGEADAATKMHIDLLCDEVDRLTAQLRAVRPILVDADSTLSWIAHRTSAQMIDKDECSRISHAARAAYGKIPKESDDA